MADTGTRSVYRTWMTDSRRWDTYRPRTGDIVVATYPKCGTTWMQRIVDLLIFRRQSRGTLATLRPGSIGGLGRRPMPCLRGSTRKRTGAP